MIAAIRGEIFSLQQDSVVMMANGIGYELFCSSSTLSELLPHQQKAVTLYAYTHVTQDSLQLFGFSTQEEKQLFLSLLKVNGVGAKTAIQIISGTTLSELGRMIETGDVKGLSKLPKVGKKTAEQMILSLRGKLVLSEPTSGKRNQPKQRSEIGSALINLGFRSQDVEKVLIGLPEAISIEDGIRQGLAALTSL